MNGAHPTAPEYLPFFLPGADGSDPLFIAVVVILSIVLVSVGALYFKIHALPEHIGEKYNSTQLQLISVLVLLALFTHNNAFWVLALLIAVVRVPDFLTPLQKIAASLGKMAANEREEDSGQACSKPSSKDRAGNPPEQSVSEVNTQANSNNGEEKQSC